jgi:GntR family transcriptional regulator, transcriptional repressor for pyruvate dehydrogenase complex
MEDATETRTALGEDTVSAQVARHLLQKISREQLRPGDSVDSEVQLCRELHVSRGSVREAYRLLAALGVLEIGSGRRPRVLAVNPSALAQIFGHALQTAHATPMHVLELRRGIEVHGAQLAARFASEEQLGRLRGLILDMRASLCDDARRIQCDLEIHRTLADAGGNPLHALVLSALNTAILQSLRDDHVVHHRSEAEQVRIIDAHEAVVERVCARDPVGAAAAMSCHFDLSVNSLNRDRHRRSLT